MEHSGHEHHAHAQVANQPVQSQDMSEHAGHPMQHDTHQDATDHAAHDQSVANHTGHEQMFRQRRMKYAAHGEDNKRGYQHQLVSNWI